MRRHLERRLVRLERQQRIAREVAAPLIVFIVPVPGDGTPALATVAGRGQISREKNETAAAFEQRVRNFAAQDTQVKPPQGSSSIKRFREGGKGVT